MLAHINHSSASQQAKALLLASLSAPDFKDGFKAKCIQGSAITPALFDAAVQFTNEERGGEIHALLGWHYARFGYQVPHSFYSFAGFYQEDGELWQGKAEHWPNSFDGKYAAPKGIGAKAFLPPIDIATRKALNLPSDGSAWAAVAANPAIPIILTEGGKKGLCGLSHGYVTIAGFGVDAFSRKGEYELLPELQPFCHPQRLWIIAFDEDTKRKTRRRVRAATNRLGRYLTEAGNNPEKIAVAQWEPSQGKGLDDLVVQSGVDALHQAIAQAMPLPAWKRGGFDAYLRGKYPELFGLVHTPAIKLNQRYLSALQLPQAGGILAVSSAMGTGKTEVMKGLIAQARAIDPDCLIELIGYRNSLGKQSARRLQLDHIHDLQGEAYCQSFIEQSNGLAYCLDSLHRRIERVLRAIASGRKCLLLLDEIDAVLKHLLLGSTLGKRRTEIMLMLCELLRAVSSSGGWIVAGEADLTSLPITFLEAVTGAAAQVVLNEWQGDSWLIEAPIPLNQKGEPSSALMGQHAIARILHELASGKRVVASTDSQTWGSLLERAAIAHGYKVIRLDGTTSEQTWAHALMADPDGYLTQEQPHLFIYTPTAESGLSITGTHFNVMVTYGSHLEHRALTQLMGRVRANIPRLLYCRAFSLFDESARASDPETLLKDWQLNARYSAMGAQLGDAAPSLDLEGLGLLLHEYAAKYQARINASQSQLRDSLIAALEAQSHGVTQPQASSLDAGFKDAISMIREDIKIEKAEDFAQKGNSYRNQAGKEITVDVNEARRILASSASTTEARTIAQKVLLLHDYPGLPGDDADFVLRNIVQGNGRGLRQHQALFLAQHPKVAQAIDQLCWQEQASAKMLWLPSIKREFPKATLMTLSGLLELLELEEYQESSPEVQRVRDFAITYQADIKRVMGLWCSEDHTGIQIVNKLAKRLGCVPKIVRKVGPRGHQVKVWGWCEKADWDRDAVHDALHKKWAEVLAEVEPVASVLEKETPIGEVEATETIFSSNSGEQVAKGKAAPLQFRAIRSALADLSQGDYPIISES